MKVVFIFSPCWLLLDYVPEFPKIQLVWVERDVIPRVGVSSKVANPHIIAIVSQNVT